jgi:hypothetical protein
LILFFCRNNSNGQAFCPEKKLNQELQMSALRKKIFILCCIISSFTLWGPFSYAETAISENTLPSDIVVEEAYQPGTGLPVGKVKAVRGEVLLFHRDRAVGYRIQTGLPLYQGDTVWNRETGWILCALVDHSQIALMPQTALGITGSSYNSARKTGGSFLNLEQGSARFKLMPRSDLSSHEFKVETQTASITARRGDFIVKANPEATEIIAFDNSRLEVTGMAAPEEVTFLTDFQRTTIRKDLPSKTVETVSPEELESLKAQFHLTPRTNMFAAGAGSTHENEPNTILPAEEGNDEENSSTGLGD